MYICPAALEHAKEKLRRIFHQFEGVEKSSEALEIFTRSPALFIVPYSCKPYGRPIDGGTRFSRAEEEFSALIVLKSTGRETLFDLNKAVQDTFQGVRLPLCERPISWTRGRLVHSGGGIVAWENIFQTLIRTGD